MDTLLLEFEVCGDEFDRFQNPISFDAFVRIRQVTNNDHALGLPSAACDFARDLRIVCRDFDGVESLSSQSQQPVRRLNDEYDVLRLTFDLHELGL